MRYPPGLHLRAVLFEADTARVPGVVAVEEAREPPVRGTQRFDCAEDIERIGSAAGQVRRLNQTLSGWANYFCLGPVRAAYRAAYRAVDVHARLRLRQWLRRKHKLAGRGYTRFPDSYLYEVLHLLHLEPLAATCPWAKA